MLQDRERSSAYLFSPWGNLLDIRPAKASLASADAFAVEHDVRLPTKVHLWDLHALIGGADAAGYEHMDIRSDGERGTITSVHHDRPDNVVYDGDALAVDAMLHRLRRGSLDHSCGTDQGLRVVTYLGKSILGITMWTYDTNHVRLHLRAGRERATSEEVPINSTGAAIRKDMERDAKARRDGTGEYTGLSHDQYPPVHRPGELAGG